MLPLGLLISTVTKNQFAASQAALIAGFLPAFELSGFIFEIDSMPAPIRLLTRVLPPGISSRASRRCSWPATCRACSSRTRWCCAGDRGRAVLPCSSGRPGCGWSKRHVAANPLLIVKELLAVWRDPRSRYHPDRAADHPDARLRLRRHAGGEERADRGA